MTSWKETVKRTQLAEGESMSERPESDDDNLSSTFEGSSEEEETPPKITKSCDIRGFTQLLSTEEETPKSKRHCNNRSENKPTSSMERMMEAMIANQEQLIAANKALEKQVKDLNEVVASCKQAHASKKVTEKVIVPNVIKGLVRDAHKEAIAAGKSAWLVEKGKSIHSPENSDTSSFVRSYVTGIAIDVDKNVLHEAMKNYFRSKRQDASRKRDQHREKMRKYERKNQKKKTRLRALVEKTWSAEKKAKIKASLINDFMSSEDEDEEDPSKRIVRPLSWESARMKAVKDALDSKWKKLQSQTSRRQTLNRVLGDLSNRPCPERIPEELTWAVVART